MLFRLCRRPTHLLTFLVLPLQLSLQKHKLNRQRNFFVLLDIINRLSQNLLHILHSPLITFKAMQTDLCLPPCLRMFLDVGITSPWSSAETEINFEAECSGATVAETNQFFAVVCEFFEGRFWEGHWVLQAVISARGASRCLNCARHVWAISNFRWYSNDFYCP